MDLRQAKGATRDAAFGGFFLAGLTLLVVLLAQAAGPDSLLACYVSLWDLVDVGFLGLLGFGTLRGSRLASVMMLVVHVGTNAAVWAINGNLRGLVLVSIFALVFARGVAGAYARHRLEPPTDVAPPPKWFLIGAPILTLIAIVAAVAALQGGGGNGAALGSQVPTIDKKYLRNEGVLEFDEKIALVATDTGRIRDGGSLLTNRRVVAYSKTADGYTVHAMTYGAIREVVPVLGDGGDTAITITGEKGAEMVLYAPSDGTDEDMLEGIRQRREIAQLGKVRPVEPRPAPAADAPTPTPAVPKNRMRTPK